MESLKAWLRTVGLESKKGQTTPLAERFLERGFNDLATWELVWVEIVFNWPTSRWYVLEMGLGCWTIKELAEKLQVSVAKLASRTVKNAISELVGLFEHTPIGKDLGQGEVMRGNPRIVERRGNPYPSEEAVKLALDRLFAERDQNCLCIDEPFLWPWVVFGCSQRKIVEMMGDSLLRRFFTLRETGDTALLCRR